ncbi:MAG: NADH:flavin oxidoreductase/NADH oxidase [Burkholderiales bacterium]|nr:NADH:flavin oxidoreductase/NADH oxidase [Burkholderiales bacterium]
MPHLFTPIQLGGLTLPNRIVIAPMCQYSAVDGSAQDWHMIHLGQLAISGAGMLIIEATAVSAAGRITPGCLGLYSDANEAALARVLRALRAHAPIPVAMQIGHAGRKASSEAPWDGGGLIPADAPRGWQTVGPSALPQLPGEPPARELSRAEIREIVDAFAATAARAARLGIDALELHAAHGYLLHSFLSPLANQRGDDYGGSLENRMRLVLEVFDAVRAVFPRERPVGVRISASDWVDGGWDVAQSIALAQALRARGCAWLDCSSGGVAPALQKIPLRPGYQVPFAEAIRQAVPGLPIIAVGLITDPHMAEEIVASGKSDMVALARGMLYNPRWPWHAAAALGATVTAPRQYWRSAPREHAEVLGTVKFGAR